MGFNKDYINSWFCTMKAPSLNELEQIGNLFEKDSFENISPDRANHKINRPDIYGFIKETYQASDNDIGYYDRTRKGRPQWAAMEKAGKELDDYLARKQIDDLWEEFIL